MVQINQQKDQNALIRHEMDFEIKRHTRKEKSYLKYPTDNYLSGRCFWKILGFFVLIATFIFYYKQKQIKQQRESQKSLEEAAREIGTGS
ncbi:MAG: hypothetical protein IPI30_09240 [Saprospiraceae bacterium]|nr:hypothetical protein [Candidatus Vicinibacter affinis]